MKLTRNITGCWNRINIVDRYLVVIMILLFAYSVTAIFMFDLNSDIVKNIDTIVRTTMASIFGYLISSNFIKNETKNRTEIVNETLAISPEALESKEDITITSTEKPAEVKPKARENLITAKARMVPMANELQVNVVGLLCISALIVLFSVRILFHLEISDIELISQLRDIVCGSVGFLIGTPTESVNKG